MWENFRLVPTKNFFDLFIWDKAFDANSRFVVNKSSVEEYSEVKKVPVKVVAGNLSEVCEPVLEETEKVSADDSGMRVVIPVCMTVLIIIILNTLYVNQRSDISLVDIRKVRYPK